MRYENDAPEILYILYKYLIVFNDFKSEMVLVELQADNEPSHIDEVEKAVNNRNYATYEFRTVGETTSTLTDEEHKANIRKGIAHCKEEMYFKLFFQDVSFSDMKEMILLSTEH